MNCSQNVEASSRNKNASKKAHQWDLALLWWFSFKREESSIDTQKDKINFLLIQLALNNNKTHKATRSRIANWLMSAIVSSSV